MKKEWLDYCTQEIITNVLTSNGMLSRLDPPLEVYLNLPEAKKVRCDLEKFLTINPHILLTIDEFLEEVADGDADENQEKYSELVWWTELNNALDDFFNADVEQYCYDRVEAA